MPRLTRTILSLIRRDRTRLASLLLPCILLALLVQCRPREKLPSGFFLAGDPGVFRAMLEEIQELRRTPAAATAGGIRESLEGCEGSFEALAPSGDPTALSESLRCLDGRPLRTELESVREGADLVAGLEIEGGNRLLARATRGTDTSWTVVVEVGDLPRDHPLRFLLPGSEAPGPTVLSVHDALLQGRFSADHGLDISRWIPEDEQVEALYRLNARIFSQLVLSGSWELAVYTPREGDLLAPIALAFDVENRAAAVAAWQEYLREVQRSWGFVPVPIAIEGREGACLNDLRVLPGLAPCYVFSDRALILGWNRATLERALRPEPGTELASESRLVVELSALPPADRTLTESLLALRGDPDRSDSSEGSASAFPWDRLTVAGRRIGSRYRLEARLAAKGAQ